MDEKALLDSPNYAAMNKHEILEDIKAKVDFLLDIMQQMNFRYDGSLDHGRSIETNIGRDTNS